MKIPKYIDEAIKRREKAAEIFNRYDFILSRWCHEHNIESDQINGAVESVAFPAESSKSLREAILSHDKKTEKRND